MDQTHIHLVITHLPIFGSILGGLVLAYGLWTKSNETKIAAYGLFIISSMGVGIAYLTGEAAEESVEHLPGIFEATIERHEDFAIYALVSLIILGVASIIGIFLTLRKSPATRTIAFVIFLISLVSFGLVARTGYLGGQIRHSEIVKDLTISLKNIENQEDDDD
ncbi:hypothetical protein [uncultured Mesonia sp.]|uniref:hypothetical protein n=1 Tax=uncultured Mesonia sp. TaxID=399731 RepID=UPI00374EA767